MKSVWNGTDAGLVLQSLGTIHWIVAKRSRESYQAAWFSNSWMSWIEMAALKVG